MEPQPDHSFAGIPVYVSPYAEKDTIRFIPNWENGKPIIITDAWETVESRMKRWAEAQDLDFLKQCGVIYNIGEKP
jgi:hypothetical protein